MPVVNPFGLLVLTPSLLAYVKVVAGLLIFAAVMTAIGAFANALGLKSNDLHRKYVFYKTATCLALLCGSF